MQVSTSMQVSDNTELLVRKVWDYQDIADPSADLVIRFDFDATIHITTQNLERLFGVINSHLEQVHKARKAEKDAERYAEAMFDQMLSGQESLS